LVSVDPKVQDELESSFEKALEANNPKDALLYLGNRLAPGQVDEYRLRKAESELDRNFLPHLGRTAADRREKALFLAEIAARIIEVKREIRTVDDKDHYANKRLKLAGSLLAELFRISFRNLTRDLKYQLERITIRRHIEFSIANANRPGIITERVQHAIATGNWARRRMGVTSVEEADRRLRGAGGKVFVDGIIAGYTKDPAALAEELREYRRQGKISTEVNVAFHPSEKEGGRDELYVNCDAGRVRRPLLIVEDGLPRISEDHITQLEQGRVTWQDLLRMQVVELLDADEEENTLVAMYESDL